MTTLAALAKSGTGGANLRDLYDYILAGDNPMPNAPLGGEAGSGSIAPGLSWTEQNTGADGNIQMPNVTFTPDPLFAEGVTYNPGNAEGGASSFIVDPSKFPTTRFGDVTRTAPVDENSDLLNPRLVYDDPNYGRITLLANLKPDKVNNMASAAIMAALMAGMGGIGMPSWATSGAGLARGVGSGQGLNFGTLAGMIGSALGMPAWARTLASLAIGNATRRT